MTATTPIAAPQHTFTDPAGGAWALDRTMLDFHANGWQWDGRPYDPATGPVLHDVNSGRRELLVSLAGCAGLLQIPLDAGGDLAHLIDPQDALFPGRTGNMAGAR